MSEDFEDGYDGLPDEEIKSCPFCGNRIFFIEFDEAWQVSGHTENCYCDNFIVVFDKSEFLEYWNRRA